MGQRLRAVGLWLGLDTVPAQEPQNGENDLRVLSEVGRGHTAKVADPVLSCGHDRNEVTLVKIPCQQ